VTRVVDQLLQALVEEGRSGLAELPPRHDPPPPFAALEQEIAGAFPALAQVRYPAVLQAVYAHVLPFLDCSIVWFEASPAGAPLRQLRTLVFDGWWPDQIAGQGLLVVAIDANTSGALCLDTRVGDSPGAWPVVLWDYSWRQVTTRPFSSAERMLACVTHRLRGGRVADMAAIDPQGSAATTYSIFDE
jgi:hypothetical protein